MAKKKSADSVRTFLGIVVGLFLVFIGVYGIIAWWWDELYMILKGGVGLVLALIGLITIMVSTES